ncbi:hypothetical protein DY000_02004392 [Brassica cretica]|uniref:Uncharacterized protein n=1 Tax=Brassica cretica TaxID=69181 RepID=A0ABQ7BWD6_BRACR|nr:hypothetical protein DY000_02004392 [Brassica cretica]
MAVLTAAEQNLVKSKADLERQRAERRGGHWLGRLLRFCCRSLVRAVLLWSRRLPVKRRWHEFISAREMLYVSSRLRKLRSSPLEAHQSSCGGRVFTVLSLVMCVSYLLETVKNRLWFGRRKEGRCSSLFKQSCDIGVKASG